jgi:hypothetical protein
MENAEGESMSLDESREPTMPAGEPSGEDKNNEEGGDEVPAETVKFFNLNTVCCAPNKVGAVNACIYEQYYVVRAVGDIQKHI